MLSSDACGCFLQPKLPHYRLQTLPILSKLRNVATSNQPSLNKQTIQIPCGKTSHPIGRLMIFLVALRNMRCLRLLARPHASTLHPGANIRQVRTFPLSKSQGPVFLTSPLEAARLTQSPEPWICRTIEPYVRVRSSYFKTTLTWQGDYYSNCMDCCMYTLLKQSILALHQYT